MCTKAVNMDNILWYKMLKHREHTLSGNIVKQFENINDKCIVLWDLQ